jgi:hypothetical protein
MLSNAVLVRTFSLNATQSIYSVVITDRIPTDVRVGANLDGATAWSTNLSLFTPATNVWLLYAQTGAFGGAFSDAAAVPFVRITNTAVQGDPPLAFRIRAQIQ